MPPSRWQSVAHSKRTLPMVLRRRTTVPFNIFYHRPRATNVPFTFFIFARGRRAFLSHFLSSPVGDERSFYIFQLRPRAKSILFTFYYLRPWATSVLFLFYYLPSRRTSVLFLFSANVMLLRRGLSCFFSVGLISNAHRAERSTNFLIMESIGDQGKN